MRNKYLNGTFGVCQRVLCEKHLVLPIGLTGSLSKSRVKIFCPLCEEVYVPRIKFIDIDGAYFGTSFPHIFFQTFPELTPTEKFEKYQPKIYGFKIFGGKFSKYKGLTEEDIENMNKINEKKIFIK